MNGGVPDPGTKHGAWGKTHRYYTFTPSTSVRIAFNVPKNCVGFGVVAAATPLRVSVGNIGATKAGPPAMVDEKSVDITADAITAGRGFLPTRPVQGGELIVIEDGVDGATNIGAMTLVLEGISLPAAVADLEIIEA